VPKPPPVVPQSAGSKLLSNATFEVSLLTYSLENKLEEMRASATEPCYEGHPLSYWLRDVQWESSVMPQPLRPEAERAIAHIGTNAIPFLLKWMRGGSSSMAFDSGTPQAFRVLGPSARSAIPELARLATNQPQSWFGSGPLYALGSIGPEAMPAVLTILTNALVPGTKGGAIGALAAMGTNARPAVPILLRYINDENDMVVSGAVGALGVVGPGDPAALAALEHIARGPNVALRGTALQALSRFGDQAVPALIHGLGDTNNGIAYIAFNMLAWNVPKAITNSNVLAIAAARLQSQDADWREWAAYVLRAAGQQAGGVKPDFMMPISREHVRFEDATNVLRRLAPELLSDQSPR
jgi:HEAT repeat protein